MNLKDSIRLAALADIHGNLPALEAVIADAQKRGVDGFIVAGDSISGGPFPLETIERLCELKALIVRGNGEGYLISFYNSTAPAERYTASQWGTLRWCYEQMDKNTLDYIASLPDRTSLTFADSSAICVIHGSPRDLAEGIIPDDINTAGLFARAEPGRCMSLESALEQVQEPVLLCGHTHIAWQRHQNGKMAVNPGAVGAPIDGTIGAQYGILTWQNGSWSAELRVVDYDVRAVRKASIERGLLKAGGAVAHALLRNVETGRNYIHHFVNYTRDLASKAGHTDHKIIPENIWEQAKASFDWEGL